MKLREQAYEACQRDARASGRMPMVMAPDRCARGDEDAAAWRVAGEGVSGSDADALRAALGVMVVRALGGARVEWAGLMAAAPVRAIDTTAAGDCFVRVLAASLHRGASPRD